jgi:hypothetical protein
MIAGDVESTNLVCPQCHGRSAKSLGDQHPEPVFVDYRPLDVDLVRGVILHLERLAGRPRSTLATASLGVKRAPELIASGIPVANPMWDNDLDGQSNPAEFS